MKSKIYMIQVLGIIAIISFTAGFTPFFGENQGSIIFPNPKLSSSIEINNPTTDQQFSNPMEGYYIATFGFENETDGTSPGGWDITSSGGGVKVNLEFQGHNKILKCKDPWDPSDPSVKWDLDTTFDAQDHGTIEFWMATSNILKEHTVHLKNSASSQGPQFEWMMDICSTIKMKYSMI